MALGELKVWAPGQIAQYWHPSNFLYWLAAVFQVTFAGNTIEHYTDNAHSRVKLDEAQNSGSHATGHAADVYHQDHRQAQLFGDLGCTPFLSLG